MDAVIKTLVAIGLILLAIGIYMPIKCEGTRRNEAIFWCMWVGSGLVIMSALVLCQIEEVT